MIGIGDVGAGGRQEDDRGTALAAHAPARRPHEEGDIELARRRLVALPAGDMERIGPALEIRRDYPDAHYNLGRILLAQGQPSAAVEHYRQALALRPDWLPVLGEAAWLLATHPDEGVRDPKQAIMFAEHGVALTNRQNPALLDVLAAAYAASGNFDRAVVTARAAQDLIPKRDSALDQRLRLYQQHRPYVDYLSERPDPDRVVPGNYANPVFKK